MTIFFFILSNLSIKIAWDNDHDVKQGIKDNQKDTEQLRNKGTVSYWMKEYRDADKSLARPSSRCILFDGENISFDASLVIYIYIYIYILLIFLQLWL